MGPHHGPVCAEGYLLACCQRVCAIQHALRPPRPPRAVSDLPLSLAHHPRRLVHEFTQHSAAITGLAIHPTEFLMASASADRTLRLWDLESFEQVCCTPPDSGQVRRVLFSEDGGALLSGGEESLKVWGWEPVRCFEQLDLRWNRLTDMCVGPGQKLLGGSVLDAVVSVWSVDMKAMKPFDSMIPEVAPPPQVSSRIRGATVSPVRSRVVSGGATVPAQTLAQPPLVGHASGRSGELLDPATG